MEGVDEWQKKNPSHLFLAPCTPGINMEVGLDNWVDILVIALYFVFVLLVGLWVCPLQHSVNGGRGALFTIICYSKYYRAVCRHSYDFLFCWSLIKCAYGKTSNIIIFFLYSVVLLFFLYILSTVYVQKGEKYNQRLLSSGPLYDMVSCKFLDKSCISYCYNTVLFPSTFLLVDNTKWPLCL